MYGFAQLGTRLSGYLLEALGSQGSTLLNGLVSYWKLDELSGTRVDSVGSNNLTDNNTVGAVLRGPSGTVASFVGANSEYLSGSAIATSGSFSLAGWMYPNSGASSAIAGAGTSNWYLNSGYSSGFSGWFFDTVSGSVSTPVVVAPDSTWYYVVIAYDASTKKAKLSINGAAYVESDALANGVAYGTVFEFGRAGAYPATCKIGDIGTWSKVLSIPEITSLMNAGSAKKYADLTAAEKVGLVSYWNLDEPSGVRYDSHGANDLTDNNTVGNANSGPKGEVANLIAANTEGFTKTSFVFPASYTVAGWIKPGTTTLYPTLFHCAAGYPNTTQIAFYINDNSDQNPTHLALLVGDGSGYQQTTLNSLVPKGTYTFVAAKYDAATKKASLSVNGGAWTDGTALAGVRDATAATLNVGVGGTNGYFDGQMGRFGLWSAALDTTVLTSLFNLGNGKAYSDLTAAEKVGLVSYWDLSETSGNRADSHGTNTLTDNNTVGSVVNAGGAMHNAAASFVLGNNESLSYAGSLLKDMTSFTVAVWAALPGGGGGDIGSNFFMDWDAVNTYKYVMLLSRGPYSNAIYATRSSDGAAAQAIQAFVADGSFALYVAWYDAADKKVRLQINNGTVNESDAIAGTPFTAANDFRLGYLSPQKIDESAIWSRVLTADERTELWNLGKGKFYDFSQ